MAHLVQHFESAQVDGKWSSLTIDP